MVYLLTIHLSLIEIAEIACGWYAFIILQIWIKKHKFRFEKALTFICYNDFGYMKEGGDNDF